MRFSLRNFIFFKSIPSFLEKRLLSQLSHSTSPIMINPQILELFTCIAPFRRRVFCLISAIDVACLCIGLDLSLSRKERDVLLNPTPQLLRLSDLSHCAHYVDHPNQLMLIGRDLSKPTVALLRGISRTTMSAATRRDHQSTTQLGAS